MPKKQEKDKFSFTVCGEFFPELYPAFRSQKWSRGEADPLATEMRLFCACRRWAFNRLLEGASRDEIKKLGQELFGLNSRYADDARLKAQAVLDSRKELLEIEIEETEKKLGRARKKLGVAMRKLAKAEEKGATPDVVERLCLAASISHLSEQTGTDKLGRPKMSRAPRVEGRLWLPEKHRDLVRIWLAMKLPYTVELIRTVEGRYLVHLTFDPGGVREPNFAKGCLALDTNPDGVALCNVNASGQPEPWLEGFSVPYPDNLGKYEGEFQVITYLTVFFISEYPT